MTKLPHFRINNITVTVWQVELGNSEEKTVSIQSQFGGEQAGIKLKMKSSAMTREIHGNLRHNSSWLQGRGVPLVVEVTEEVCLFCSLLSGLTGHCLTFVSPGSHVPPGNLFTLSV